MSRFEIDQERLSAYLDGEMTPEESRAFEVDLENNPELAEMAMAWADTEEALRDMVPTPSQDHLESLMVSPRRGVFSPLGCRWPPLWRWLPLALLAGLGLANGAITQAHWSSKRCLTPGPRIACSPQRIAMRLKSRPAKLSICKPG